MTRDRALQGRALVAAAIGAIAAGRVPLRWPSAHLGDEYLPFTNDSFYHARRILDLVADPSPLHEVDPLDPRSRRQPAPLAVGLRLPDGLLVNAGPATRPLRPAASDPHWMPVAAVFVSERTR